MLIINKGFILNILASLIVLIAMALYLGGLDEIQFKINTSSFAALGSFLYMLSHCVRYVRLKFLINSLEIRKKLLAFYLIIGIVGLEFSFYFKEISILVLFVWLLNSVRDGFVVAIISRMFDSLALFLFYVVLGLGQVQLLENQSQLMKVIGLFLIIMIIAFFSFPSLYKRVVEFLVTRKIVRADIHLLRLVKYINELYERVLSCIRKNWGMLTISTLSIWVLEVASFGVLLKNENISLNLVYETFIQFLNSFFTLNVSVVEVDVRGMLVKVGFGLLLLLSSKKLFIHLYKETFGKLKKRNINNYNYKYSE